MTSEPNSSSKNSTNYGNYPQFFFFLKKIIKNLLQSKKKQVLLEMNIFGFSKMRGI